MSASDIDIQSLSPGDFDGHLLGLGALLNACVADGAVQLDCDTPPNQPHRAEVAKLLVHPEFRRRGIARALMVAIEGVARTLGRTLITLDTASVEARALYLSLGYRQAGVIPGYSKDPIEDRYDATTILFKTLPPI